MNLLRNERVKLLSSTLNNLGLTVIATGVIAPVANLLYGFQTVAAQDRVMGLTGVWLSSGLILLVAAQDVLGGIRE